MSRVWALTSAAALLLAGVTIGALGAHIVQSHHIRRFDPGPPDPAVFLRELEDRLGLTADQKEKVLGILEETHRKGDAIRQAVKPQLDRQMEETHRQLLALLTPEQRAKFEIVHRAHRAHAARLFLGAGPGHGAGRAHNDGLPPGPAQPGPESHESSTSGDSSGQATQHPPDPPPGG